MRPERPEAACLAAAVPGTGCAGPRPARRREPRPPRPAAPFGARFHSTRFNPATFVPSMLRISRPVTSEIVIFTSPAGALFSQ